MWTYRRQSDDRLGIEAKHDIGDELTREVRERRARHDGGRV